MFSKDEKAIGACEDVFAVNYGIYLREDSEMVLRDAVSFLPSRIEFDLIIRFNFFVARMNGDVVLLILSAEQ